MNLANKLTFLRIFLVIPYVILLLQDSPVFRLSALVIFIIAAFTDYLDGMIARKNNQVSNLGKFLDPLADKLIISSSFIIFIQIESLNVPSWAVILIISREFIINGLRMYAASKGKIIAASNAGKFKTFFQITAIILITLCIIFNILLNFVQYIVITVSIVTLFSGVLYLYNNKELLKEDI